MRTLPAGNDSLVEIDTGTADVVSLAVSLSTGGDPIDANLSLLQSARCPIVRERRHPAAIALFDRGFTLTLKLGSQPLSSCTTMDLRLHQIGPMWLVLGEIEYQLDGAASSEFVPLTQIQSPALATELPLWITSTNNECI